MRGYTETQITDFARSAREQNLAAAEGTKQTIGTTEVDGQKYPEGESTTAPTRSTTENSWLSTKRSSRSAPTL
ncbi:hypothetical protein ACIBEK_07585 [Nocardia fusca]|uniref:hypothetical protein n=1 Tax=Nocardia fusca TaxID=941183 RepID=UPI0037A25933